MNTEPNASEEPCSWRMAVGLDGSEGSQRALRYAGRLARSLAAEVIAVHVIDTTPYTYYPHPMPVLDDEAVKRFEGYLQGWCQPLREAGVPCRPQLQSGRPATVLNEVAETEQADLVVVGSRGHGSVAEMLLGSVSHELSHRCTRPVLIVSPRSSEPVTWSPPFASGRRQLSNG